MEAPMSKNLERMEALARLDKVDLEKDKLRLEQKVLNTQLSRAGRCLEWLKAATPPVAVISVAVTLWVGIGQIYQVEENRAADRFEKALNRLSSKEPNERIAGISSIRLFLSDQNPSRQ